MPRGRDWGASGGLLKTMSADFFTAPHTNQTCLEHASLIACVLSLYLHDCVNALHTLLDNGWDGSYKASCQRSSCAVSTSRLVSLHLRFRDLLQAGGDPNFSTHNVLCSVMPFFLQLHASLNTEKLWLHNSFFLNPFSLDIRIVYHLGFFAPGQLGLYEQDGNLL